MSDFIKVAATADLPDPGRQLVELYDRIVALFHVGGEFYCIDDVCTHDGGPLSEGKLADYAIACPRHGAKFDIRTGKALTMPATEDTVAHQVKVENGQVYVRINDAQPHAPGAPSPTPPPSESSSQWPASVHTTAAKHEAPAIAEPPMPKDLSEDLVRE